MSYQLSIKPTALKALEKMNEPEYSAIKAAIQKLAHNPRPAGCKKLKGRNGWRIRVGNYRVIYNIQDNSLSVEVVAIGHRKDIYE